MISLREQLDIARRVKRWSIAKLLKESGLECDRCSLQRKLTGTQSLRTEEAEALAKALDCTLVWPTAAAPIRRRKVAEA